VGGNGRCRLKQGVTGLRQDKYSFIFITLEYRPVKIFFILGGCLNIASKLRHKIDRKGQVLMLALFDTRQLGGA
jgi:hypothetical protein